jgi:hypothetical protein
MLTSICPTTASTSTSKLGARSQWNIAACRGRLCGGWHSTPHVAQSLRHSSYRSRGPWSSIIRGYLSSASTNFLHPLLRGRVRCPWLFARKVSSRAPLWRLSLCAACRFARQAKQPLRPPAFVSSTDFWMSGQWDLTQPPCRKSISSETGPCCKRLASRSRRLGEAVQCQHSMRFAQHCGISRVARVARVTRDGFFEDYVYHVLPSLFL